MSRHGQRLPDYLGHIAEAIERIECYIVSIDQLKSISVVTSDPSDPAPHPAPAPWRP